MSSNIDLPKNNDNSTPPFPSSSISTMNISPISDLNTLNLSPNLPKWEISPHGLSLHTCKCVNLPSRKSIKLQTYEDHLKFNLDRIDKVYLRLCHQKINSKILEASERVLRELRLMGFELFHFIARRLSEEETKGKRNGITIYFLIPDYQNNVVGHRFIAEILVQIYNDKNRGIENIASRFWIDLEDWKLSQPYTYYALEDNQKELEMSIPENRKMSGEEMINNIIVNLSKLKSNLIINSQKLIPIITRTTKELKVDNLLVVGMEFELVYRDCSNGKIKKVIRIGLKVKSRSSPSDANSVKEGEVVGKEEEGEEPEIGAVILLAIERDKIKNIAIMYQGDWPVVHFYRDTIPPPSLDGLERLVED